MQSKLYITRNKCSNSVINKVQIERRGQTTFGEDTAGHVVPRDAYTQQHRGSNVERGGGFTLAFKFKFIYSVNIERSSSA